MSIGFAFRLPGYFPAYQLKELISTVETGYISTTVYPLFYKHTVIEFDIPVEWGNCVFDVYRSELEVGPWFKVTDSPITGRFYKDTSAMDFSNHRQAWYRVECRMPDGRRIQGPSTTWENKRNNWVELRANEIERREKILLQKFTGVRSLIFRRRHWGMRCPNCWNSAVWQVTKDHCSVCFGTSFKGGYFDGIETLLQYDPNTDNAVKSYQGTVEPDHITAWTISKPNIEPFDLILRVPDLRVYRVEQITTTELQTHQVRQMLALVELAKETVEYKLVKQILPESYL